MPRHGVAVDRRIPRNARKVVLLQSIRASISIVQGSKAMSRMDMGFYKGIPAWHRFKVWVSVGLQDPCVVFVARLAENVTALPRLASETGMVMCTTSKHVPLIRADTMA